MTEGAEVDAPRVQITCPYQVEEGIAVGRFAKRKYVAVDLVERYPDESLTCRLLWSARHFVPRFVGFI